MGTFLVCEYDTIFWTQRIARESSFIKRSELPKATIYKILLETSFQLLSRNHIFIVESLSWYIQLPVLLPNLQGYQLASVFILLL